MGSLKVKFQIEFTKESLNKKVLNTQKNKIGRNTGFLWWGCVLLGTNMLVAV